MAKKSTSIDEAIKRAVKEGIAAGYSIKQQEVKNCYKQTEKLLYSFNDLKSGIKAYEDEIVELKTYGLQGKSKSIVFMPSGSRINGDDLLESKIEDLRYKIQRNEREIKKIEGALDTVREDNYFTIIDYKYFQNKSDGEISELLECDESTVRRNKKRLVNKIELRLFGADALL